MAVLKPALWLARIKKLDKREGVLEAPPNPPLEELMPVEPAEGAGRPYCSTLTAPSGQFSWQLRHSAQASASVTMDFFFFWSRVKHPLGHTSTQVPQPVHFFASTTGGIASIHPLSSAPRHAREPR
jgi:hypothetical protein